MTRLSKSDAHLAPSPEFLRLSAALVQRLPMKTRRWSRSERERWLAAYTAAVDLDYEVEPE